MGKLTGRVAGELERYNGAKPGELDRDPDIEKYVLYHKQCWILELVEPVLITERYFIVRRVATRK